jgi:hypothetical protein
MTQEFTRTCVLGTDKKKLKLQAFLNVINISNIIFERRF